MFMITPTRDHKKRPFLSIITVHLQDFERLAATLSSIECMLGKTSVEWVVIDGGSTPVDASHQRVMSDVGQFAAKLVSEPDEGIYDAMNKGMSFANGEYVLFLNAGDRISPGFSPGPLMNSLRGSNPDMIWGRTRFEYPDGSYGVKKLRGPKWMPYGMPICHQAVLFLNKRFREMRFDTDFKIAADYELIARALKSGAIVRLVQDVICDYEAGGISQRNQKASLQEESIVRSKYYRIPAFLSGGLSFAKLLLWKLSDLSPALNRAWRERV